MVWIGASRRNRALMLYVALTFRRGVTPIQPKRLPAVDFNALHNGVVWTVVEVGRVVAKGAYRPGLAKLGHLQKKISRLDSYVLKGGCLCEQATAANNRLYRYLRQWELEAAKKLVALAARYKAAVVADMPKDKSIRELKEGNYPSSKHLPRGDGRPAGGGGYPRARR